jgi:GNAT superfamily N-acetyltransferase
LATLVGTLDDHVLAYGLAHLESIARGDGTLGVIDELFVAEPARAVGVGEVLLAALVAWCRDAQCIGIDATALPGDRQAKNFFESAGFKARRLIMHTDL